MEWKVIDKYVEHSLCRRYSVAKVIVKDVILFDAWVSAINVYGKPVTGKQTLLGHCQTQSQAKALCEQHFNENEFEDEPPAQARLGL